MTNTDIPDVGDTDLTREELEEVAAECGIDPEGLDDQELFERIGVALGEIEAEEVEGDGEDGDRDDGQASGSGLRAKVAATLRGAADRLRPADEAPSDDAGPDDAGAADDNEGAETDEDDEDADDGDEDDGDEDEDDGDEDDGAASEQTLPGEPIEGPTRDEIRDELRELGLPVTGTKDELQERLEQARQEQEDDRQADDDQQADDEDAETASDGQEPADEEPAGEAGQGDDDPRLRDRAAERLHDVAEWLRETGRDEGGSSATSKLKRAGSAVRRRLPFIGGGGTS